MKDLVFGKQNFSTFVDTNWLKHSS